jgi:hypothetical protein
VVNFLCGWNPEKTTDLSQVTDKLYHIKLNRVQPVISWIRSHNVRSGMNWLHRLLYIQLPSDHDHDGHLYNVNDDLSYQWVSWVREKSLKISKGQSESVYRRRTDNTMVKRQKNRQHNSQKKRDKKNKQRSTKHAHKTKDRVTRTSLKTRGELRCSAIFLLYHWQNKLFFNEMMMR